MNILSSTNQVDESKFNNNSNSNIDICNKCKKNDGKIEYFIF